MLGYDKAPFTCNYVPARAAKGVVPIFAMAFLIGATCSRGSSWRCFRRKPDSPVLLLLAILFVILRIAALRQRVAGRFRRSAVQRFRRWDLHT